MHTGVRAAGGLLALLVAWTHLLHPTNGLPRLLLYMEVGTLYDPRPPLFVASSLLILAGIALAIAGRYRRVIYVGGIVLMVGHLFIYVGWHSVLDHGAFWPYIEPFPHEGLPLLDSMYRHLADDRLALVSKLSEAGLAILLVVLTIEESRTGD